MNKASRVIDVESVGSSFVRAELFLYEQLQEPIASRFYAAHVKKSQQRFPAGTTVRYSLQHFVLFCFVAAAQGVIGNASYAAISKLISSLRHPKTELLPSKTTFEAVVSRNTYNRIRRERHPGNRAGKHIGSDTQESIEKTYRLTLAVKRTVARKKPSRTKSGK